MSDDRLRVRAGGITGCTNHLGRKLASILGRAPGHFRFDLRQVDGTSFDGNKAVYGLNARLYFVGARGEVFRLRRPRGDEAILIPLLDGDLPEIRHWLSVSMFWGPLSARSRTRQIVYESAQVAVYEAAFQAIEALQLIRAEWVGKRLAREGGGTEFDSGAAGHPHWHVDAVSEIKKRLRRHSQEQREQQLFRDEFMRKEAVERSYVDFEELLEAIAPAETEAVFEYEELHDALCSIHLAQCAPWHREPWDGRIDVASPQAHNPIDFAQLANWICSTVAYLRHEFEKAMA